MSKCAAKTHEGKRCFFDASKEVDGKHYCGNHAARLRQPIMFSRAPRTVVKEVLQVPVLESLAKPRMVDQVYSLIEAGIPKGVIEQILQAWKAGAL